MFIPRNIDKRSKNLEIIQAKKFQEFYINLEKIKLKTLNNNLFNPQEQLFINLIKDCQIKIDQEELPFRIFLFQDEKYIFDYSWKDNRFWFQKDHILTAFESKFNMSYHIFQDFIKDILEKHFKFRPFTTLTSMYPFTVAIEKHFKFRPSIN